MSGALLRRRRQAELNRPPLSAVLAEAKEALQILNGRNKDGQRFPFICVTNGGGYKEQVRSEKLTKELGIDVSAVVDCSGFFLIDRNLHHQIALHQIVQSHSIFRPLAQRFGEKPVLVVGGFSDRCRKVAEEYGFKHVYIPADVVHWSVF